MPTKVCEGCGILYTPSKKHYEKSKYHNRSCAATHLPSLKKIGMTGRNHSEYTINLLKCKGTNNE